MIHLTKLAEAAQSVNITKDALTKITSDYCNWIIPGRVMCGPYPGLDGINFVDEAAAQDNLKKIMADGINTFVCLQDEVLSLDKGESHPYFPKYQNYTKNIATSNIRCIHLPLKDQSVPSKPDLVKQMDLLAKEYLEGRNIYIHCAGGHGRTGIYVACFLLALFRNNKNITTDYLLQYVQFAHDSRRIQDKRVAQMLFVSTPNTTDQRKLVHDFAKFVEFI